jgi:hypothetical protein
LNNREEIRNPETVNWYEDNLRAGFVKSKAASDFLLGTPGDAIGNALNLSIKTSPPASSARNQDSPDVIRPIGSTPVPFRYSTPPENAAAVWSPAFVYFAFGFEGIDGAATRVTVMDRVQELLSTLTPPDLFAQLVVQPEDGMTVPGLGPVAIQKLPETDKVVLNATNSVGVASLDFEVIIDGKCDPDTLTIDINNAAWAGGATDPVLFGSQIRFSVFVISSNGFDRVGLVDVLEFECTVQEFVQSIRPANIIIPNNNSIEAFNDDGNPVNVVPKSLSLTLLKKGDPDGDGEVDAQDAILAQQFILEIKIPTVAQTLLADIFPAKNGDPTCGDGMLDISDIGVYLMILLGEADIDVQC